VTDPVVLLDSPGCDLVYVAEDAKIGCPAVRFGVPDVHFHAWRVRQAFGGYRTADQDEK
jgi:enoyl-CoA hydratase/carnithine racemase